jgi:hypothetical protein
MSTEYEVVYLARSPASTRQEDFAAMVDEICNSHAVGGWTLVSAVGDYGAKVTLGVWLYFGREAEEGSMRSRPSSSSYASGSSDDLDEEPLDSGLGEDEASSEEEEL